MSGFIDVGHRCPYDGHRLEATEHEQGYEVMCPYCNRTEIGRDVDRLCELFDARVPSAKGER